MTLNVTNLILSWGAKKNIRLIPSQSMLRQRNDENFESWCCSDSDSYFIVRQSCWPGWFMLEFQVNLLDEREHERARFYYSSERSYLQKERSFVLPFQSGKMQRRIVRLPRVRLARFDPMESAGHFAIRHFALKPLLPSFARDRMSWRLARLYGRTQLEVLQVFAQQASQQSDVNRDDLLYQAYDASFEQRARSGISYQQWITQVELPYLAAMRACMRPTSGILFSIIIPVYNPKPVFLQQAVLSVQRQYYSNWELCLVDDASTRSDTRDLLRRFAEADARIKIVFREQNGHISVASNSAASLASGEYLVLLDQDDELAEHALWAVWEALQSTPGAHLLYSDEDKLDETGRRYEPHFKPDWNPALQLSHNYTSHLGVYKADLFRQVGGFREGVEGAQDYDLFLRCLAALDQPDQQIVHIPQVLYHWRALAGSTAQAASQKTYTWEAGLRVLEHYLQLTGQQAVVEKGLLPNTYDVRYALPESLPKVSLLVPTRDGLEVLCRCVESVLNKTTYTNYELLIIDNASQQVETLTYLDDIQQDARVRVLSWPHAFNYSAINNFAVGETQGELLCLLNNDVEVIAADWLNVMVSHAIQPTVGCVGAKLLYGDGRIQHAGVVLGIGGVAGHAHKYYPSDHHGYFSRLKVTQNYSAVTAACLLVRKVVYEQVGGLDEINLQVAFNDIDFCLKVREAGYRHIWTPYALLYHHESVSRGQDDTSEKKKRFLAEMNYMRQRWRELLQADPCYSPHLSLEYEDFSISSAQSKNEDIAVSV